MTAIITDDKKIEDLLGRYVQTLYPSREKVVEIFKSGKRLKFYLGIDPTGAHVHLGHATNLLWLKKFAALGHEVVLLIGDFTARIGDPTDKSAARTALTQEEVETNMATYLNQIGKVLLKDSFSVEYNSTWLSPLTFEDLIKLASHVTVQQMIQRDMFQERIKEEKPVFLHEFFYPLMQGYDSVAMRVDGEVGGNDQTFNMLMGRNFVKELLGQEKIVVTTVLLVDPATNTKIMNKSAGNIISLDDSPQEMRRKVLALDDGMVATLFELSTEVPLEWISKRQKEIEAGENPRQFKEELANELIRAYHGEAAVGEAEKDVEQDIKGLSLDQGLVAADVTPTMSAAHRLIDQGAVEVNGEVSKEWKLILNSGDKLKVGKGKFIKVK